MNNLTAIFIEAAHAASLIPFASEATLSAMRSFGNFNLLVPMLVAVAGGMAGHLFNYFLGWSMMRLPSSPAQHPIYAKLQHHFNRYGFLLLVFCFLPLGNFLSFIAGSVKTPLMKMVPLVGLGVAYQYWRLAFG